MNILSAKPNYQPKSLLTALQAQRSVGTVEQRASWMEALQKAQRASFLNRGAVDKITQMVAKLARAEGLQLERQTRHFAPVARWMNQRQRTDELFDSLCRADDREEEIAAAELMDELIDRAERGDQKAYDYVDRLLQNHPFAFAVSDKSCKYFSKRMIAAAHHRTERIEEALKTDGPAVVVMDETHMIAEGALLRIVQYGFEDPRCIPLIQQLAEDNPMLFGLIHANYLLRTASRFPVLLDQILLIAASSMFNGTVFYEASKANFPGLLEPLVSMGVRPAYHLPA